MSVTHFLRDDFIGETRWAACAENGQIVSLFSTRETDDTDSAWHGRILAGVVRAIRPAQGGAFLKLSNGTDALMRLSGDLAVAEGQRLSVRVVSEARREKSARVVPANAEDTGTDCPLDAWKRTLKCANHTETLEIAPNDHTIDEAFEEALSTTLTLPGGGLLRIETTHALTAADVDTHGRIDKGRAVNRALAINSEAAIAFAQQAMLRSLGGILVLDCVAPLSRDSAKAIRQAFSDQVRAFTRRPYRVLLPSELGLLQASIAWGIAPLSERGCTPSGKLTAETVLFDGLRALQRNAQRSPMQRHTLTLPTASHALWTAVNDQLMPQLDARYGARLVIAASDRDRVDLHES